MTIMNVVFGVGLAASGNGNEFGMLVLPWLASEDVEISATAAASSAAPAGTTVARVGVAGSNTKIAVAASVTAGTGMLVFGNSDVLVPCSPGETIVGILATE